MHGSAARAWLELGGRAAVRLEILLLLLLLVVVKSASAPFRLQRRVLLDVAVIGEHGVRCCAASTLPETAIRAADLAFFFGPRL